MNIKELRMDMLKSKKTNPDRSKVLQAILAHVQIAVTDKSRKNREVTEKDIIKAAKTELSLAKESKAQGAPYNPMVFEICESFVPQVMGEDETRAIVEPIVNALPVKNMKMMGKIMGQVSTYGETIDRGLVSKIAKEMFN